MHRATTFYCEKNWAVCTEEAGIGIAHLVKLEGVNPYSKCSSVTFRVGLVGGLRASAVPGTDVQTGKKAVCFK